MTANHVSWTTSSAEAATGPLKGTRLEELAGSQKSRWKDWVRDQPATVVLSWGGVEHVENNPYDRFVASDSGFRDLAARDKRLPTKAPIWAFEIGGRRFEVPFPAFEGGHVFRAAGSWVFLQRPPGESVYFSTRAFVSSRPFVFRDGVWRHEPSGARFDAGGGLFVGAASSCAPKSLAGFDTFWYVWSLTDPGTEVLSPGP